MTAPESCRGERVLELGFPGKSLAAQPASQKEKIMRFAKLTCIAAVALSSFLAIPVLLAAQQSAATDTPNCWFRQYFGIRDRSCRRVAK
jgi:hypothetical protein